MSTVWSICGAGSGVGKTIVAGKLCAVLPGAVYVKCGHGKPRTGKAPHFFREMADLERFVESRRNGDDHVVVESNAYARCGKGDIMVFIGPLAGRTEVRDDAGALRQAADIAICGETTSEDWSGQLSTYLPDPSIRDAVCDILAEQQRYLFGPAAAVHTKVWFELGEEHVFGAGLAALLESIDRCGSLTEAAKAVNISYRHAWDLIKTAEGHLGRELLERQTGGPGGGGSALSAAGRHMLGVFARLDREVAAFARGRFDELFHAPEPDDA